jgi:hypothetical protein
MDNMIEIKKRIKGYEDGLKALNKEFKLNPVVTLEFPQYKKLPLLVLLASKIIRKYKGVFMLSYKEE